MPRGPYAAGRHATVAVARLKPCRREHMRTFDKSGLTSSSLHSPLRQTVAPLRARTAATAGPGNSSTAQGPPLFPRAAAVRLGDAGGAPSKPDVLEAPRKHPLQPQASRRASPPPESTEKAAERPKPPPNRPTAPHLVAAAAAAAAASAAATAGAPGLRRRSLHRVRLRQLSIDASAASWGAPRTS